MAERTALIGFGVFAVIAAILWIPWATKERVVIGSTPVPPALFSITPAPIKPGGTACLTNVTFSPATEIGEIGLTTGKKPGPPLEITATGPHGYLATARIPGGYPDDPTSRFTIQSPPRSEIGTLCIHNAGKTAVSLNG